MLFMLKEKRIDAIGRWARMRREARATWAHLRAPSAPGGGVDAGAPEVSAKEAEMTAKAGSLWRKHVHPVLGKPYYTHKLTGETVWATPAEIRYYLPDELLDRALKVFTSAELEDLQFRFDALDMDGSGAIDADELRTILVGLGEKPSTGRVRALLRESDDDNSGELDYDEFVHLMLKIRLGTGATASLARVGASLGAAAPALFKELHGGLVLFKRGARGRYPHGPHCLCGCRAIAPTDPRAARAPSTNLFPKLGVGVASKQQRQRTYGAAQGTEEPQEDEAEDAALISGGQAARRSTRRGKAVEGETKASSKTIKKAK